MAYTFKHGDRPLDDYTIQRAVGAGGFGEVYYAVSDGGREVALKYLRQNPQVELRGVSHCINLKSPHLISIFDVKKNADDEYFIIMEYCSGPSLRDLLIADPEGLGPQKAAFFTREIAKGLAYLHDRGIVHRDLKPGNIFYDDGYVKIGDYGLSKFIAVSRHSAQTASVGTVHYMAPEIGSGDYSRGVDIYALGVMLYEMLLGKVPFEGSSMGEVLMKHLTAQPAVDELPDPFAQIIRKALQKDPKDRYQDVNEMVEDLLAVDQVKESLAGFSLKSLEGAIRRGGEDLAMSPMPSPNPPPPPPPLYAQPLGRQGPYQRSPESPGYPAAEPIGSYPLPGRVIKKIDKLSRKIDKKIAKLGGTPPPREPYASGPPQHRDIRSADAALPSPHHTAQRAAAAAAQYKPWPELDRRKRIALSGMLTIGLAATLAFIVGNNFSEEAGISAGILPLAIAGSVLLSNRTIAWFGIADGPSWAQLIIRLLCAGPMLMIAVLPYLDHSERNAAPLLFGLLALVVLTSWRSEFAKGDSGEIHISTALWTGLCGFIFTAIATGILNGHDKVFPLAFGTAGVASLILQSVAWWANPNWSQGESGFSFAQKQPRHAPPFTTGHGTPQSARPVAQGATYQPQPAASSATKPQPTLAIEPPPFAQPINLSTAPPIDIPISDQPGVSQHGADHPLPSVPIHDGPPIRWTITRTFWGLIGFVMFGCAIVVGILPTIEHFHYDEATGAYIGCAALAAGAFFAIRKTTPFKQVGFWRETIRPFFATLGLFGVGANVIALQRHWYEYHTTEKGLSIIGLVVASAVLDFCTGNRNRHRQDNQPFLQTPETNFFTDGSDVDERQSEAN